MTDTKRKTKTYVPQKGGSRVVQPKKAKAKAKAKAKRQEGNNDAG